MPSEQPYIESTQHGEDEDDVLDPSEQTMRPKHDAIHQQLVPGWNPILHPVWVILAFLYLGVIMIPVGYKIESLQDSVVEIKQTYDDFEFYNENNEITVEEDGNTCGIGANFNAGRICNITLTIPQDMFPPVLLYYQLTNFHQNHRSYYISRDDFQLAGQQGGDTVSRSRCKPLNELRNATSGEIIRLNPCGKVANTLFNDIIQLEEGQQDAFGNTLQLIETGIAWQSDIDYLYKQPEGFRYEVCAACDDSCCQGDDWSCREPYRERNADGSETCYSYFYPDDDTTQYLYETYPEIVSPIEGVENEHFAVWMRIATQPTFRKLYGWFDQPLRAGTTLTLSVKANYVVTRFRGSKSLILTTTNIFGGRNDYFAPFFIYTGYVFVGAAVFFGLKHLLQPRKLGDRKYLHYKEE